MDALTSYLESNRDRFVEDLKAALRIPSVSAQDQHRPDMQRCARHIADHLQSLGMTRAEVVPTAGHPLVYAEWLGAPGKPTALLYGHYDVQPPEPLEGWASPPFEPTLRDGKLYARGAADNKGNLMLRIQAIESWLATEGALPIRISFLIEGEEEISSLHLEQVCHEHADLIRADGCLWETGGRNAAEQPAIYCGAKGICYVELVARGASHDLHSSNATMV